MGFFSGVMPCHEWLTVKIKVSNKNYFEILYEDVKR
jgi:hypothetical protein